MASSVIKNIHAAFEWKSLPVVTGTEAITLPDYNEAKEFVFLAQYGTASGYQAMTFSFFIPNLTMVNSMTPTQGYYLTNSNAFCQISVDCRIHVARLVLLNITGVDYTETSRLMCFYR